jgi:hypothetical protein
MKNEIWPFSQNWCILWYFLKYQWHSFSSIIFWNGKSLHCPYLTHLMLAIVFLKMVVNYLSFSLDVSYLSPEHINQWFLQQMTSLAGKETVNNVFQYINEWTLNIRLVQNCRYTRNANLVASGVARNMRRVGNYVKDSVDDILYPYRRRPK